MPYDHQGSKSNLKSGEALKPTPHVDVRFNTSPYSTAYVRHSIGLSLVKIVLYCLISAQPLSKSMISSHNYPHGTDISGKIWKPTYFHWRKALKFIVCIFAAILSTGDGLSAMQLPVL